MTLYETAHAPRPNGHYCQAIAAGDLVFLSNQLPINPDAGDIPDGVDAQARQAIVNCGEILAAAGLTLGQVVSATVQVTSMDDWGTIDRIWAEVFGSHRPARSVVAVAALHLDARIAIQMTATRAIGG
jgi:2-iminobutanoate/2-iminopropanoate deaminase